MIQAEGLVKEFGGFTAVSDVSLSARQGELVVLLGPNGAGKTTTIRMLSAILKPTRGWARIAGYDVVQDPISVRRHVGLLTEFPGLYDRMTAMDYLDFFGSLEGVPKQQRRERSEELLKRFGVWGGQNLRLGEFSKGMRQKVALIRALIHDPAVLLLDEPTSAMDPGSARLVRESILDLKQSGRTLLICTHNLSEAELLADRIAIIRLGKIIAFDTAVELRRRLLGVPLIEVRVNGVLNGLAASLEGLVEVVARGPNWFRYRCAEPERLNPQVLRRLHEQGAEVVTLSEVPRSLEEVYLSIVEAGEESMTETEALLKRRGEAR